MANKAKQDKSQNSQSEMEHADQSSQIPAVRHVGKTLESDPEYNENPSRALAPEAGLISRGGNDISASPKTWAGSDPLNGTVTSTTGQRVEPLKTRLPGDTSSDPHTDVGADNATSLQNRGEQHREHRSNKK
ncbi:MAG: hypothetical protein ACLGSD_06630 [Acidobacteriota bacterium]